MKIQVNTQECLYIEINGWTYYIDDSTNEQFMDKWVTGTEEEITQRDIDEFNADPVEFFENGEDYDDKHRTTAEVEGSIIERGNNV